MGVSCVSDGVVEVVACGTAVEVLAGGGAVEVLAGGGAVEVLACGVAVEVLACVGGTKPALRATIRRIVSSKQNWSSWYSASLTVRKTSVAYRMKASRSEWG